MTEEGGIREEENRDHLFEIAELVLVTAGRNDTPRLSLPGLRRIDDDHSRGGGDLSASVGGQMENYWRNFQEFSKDFLAGRV